ncbi:hypothetical protein LTR17_016446 [Elasticomyces elasticus]|nr:hypothetical protein LTR17_016446 [Elasticomyces elasticus]
MPWTDLEPDDLAIILIRIRAYGLEPTSKAVLLVYPGLYSVRLALLSARIRRYNNDERQALFRDTQRLPFRKRATDMHWVYVLALLRESFWLTLCFATTPEEDEGPAMLIVLLACVYLLVDTVTDVMDGVVGPAWDGQGMWQFMPGIWASSMLVQLFKVYVVRG